MEMRKLWMSLCNLPREDLYRDLRICSKHFGPDAFFVMGSKEPRTWLSKDAIPSLHLPDQDPLLESESRDPLSEQEISSVSHSSTTCTMCKKVVAKDEYLTHFKEYHSEVQLGCPRCSSTFSSPDLLSSHYKQFHKMESEKQKVSSASSISSSSAMKCSFCDKVVTKDEYLSHFKENHLNGNQKWKSAAVAYNLWEKQHRPKMEQDNPGMDKRLINRNLSVQWRYLPESAKKPYFEEAELKVRASEKAPVLKGIKGFNRVDRMTKVQVTESASLEWMNNEENEMDDMDAKVSAGEPDPEYDPSQDEGGDNQDDHMISDEDENEDSIKKNIIKRNNALGIRGTNRQKTCVVCKSTSNDEDIR